VVYICWVKRLVIEVMITEMPLKLPGSMTEMKVCVIVFCTLWSWRMSMTCIFITLCSNMKSIVLWKQYWWSARNSHELKSHEQSSIISNQPQCELIVSTLGLFWPYERWDLSGQNSMLEALSSSLQDHAFSQPEVGSPLCFPCQCFSTECLRVEWIL